MKAKVNPETCIGCTLCVETCPKVFRMENEKSFVFVAQIPPESEESCRQAADACPVQAIEITS